MNKYEQRAARERQAAIRASMTLWTAGIALIVVLLLIFGLSGSATPQFYSKAAIGLAVLLLVLRQISRRMKGKRPRAAEPDPRSTLKLH